MKFHTQGMIQQIINDAKAMEAEVVHVISGRPIEHVEQYFVQVVVKKKA